MRAMLNPHSEGVHLRLLVQGVRASLHALPRREPLRLVAKSHTPSATSTPSTTARSLRTFGSSSGTSSIAAPRPLTVARRQTRRALGGRKENGRARRPSFFDVVEVAR